MPPLIAQSVVRIDRFMPEVLAFQKHSSAVRRISIRGRNGKIYAFLVQSALPKHARAEERIGQLLRSINSMMERSPDSRQRGLTLAVPRMVPLNTHVRLVQEDPSTFSLEDVLAEHCAARGIPMDAAIMYCFEMRKAEVLRAQEAPGDGRHDQRKAVFDHVRRELVPADILSKYVKSMMPDFTAFFLFRRQFTSHLAVSALITYALGLNKPAPHAVKIAGNLGAIIPWELAFCMDANGLLYQLDRAPFRLTPTLLHFMSPVGLNGIFTGSFLAGAQALNDPDMKLSDHVGVIMRDEIMSWSAVSVPLRTAQDADALAQKVRQNTEQISKRLAGIAADTGTGSLENLIKSASAPSVLCAMPPLWHPWL